jgi:hypothetical protein
MLTRSPWIWKKSCTRSWATFLAEGNLGRGMKWVALENLSTTVRIVVLGSDGGSPVTKSSDIWDGDEKQEVAEGGQPELAAESCSATKAGTSGTIVDHQKRCRRKARVRREPGWQVSLEE